MSFRQRFFIYCQENIVLLTGVPLIVAIHWGWSKLQHVPVLVPENQRRDLPIVTGAKYLEKKISDEIQHLTGKIDPGDVTETKPQ